jgi:predicted ATPase
MAQKKIVFTGSTYSGKSTLLLELKRNNCYVVPEAGELIIAELSTEWGIEQQKKWRSENPVEFYKLAIDRQYELELQASKSGANVIFLDRAIPDYLAFLRLANRSIPPDFWYVARNWKYDLVFVCEMIPGFDDRLSTERSLNKAESETLGILVEEVYRELRYPTITLKASSINDRMLQIVEMLESG